MLVAGALTGAFMKNEIVKGSTFAVPSDAGDQEGTPEYSSPDDPDCAPKNDIP